MLAQIVVILIKLLSEFYSSHVLFLTSMLYAPPQFSFKKGHKGHGKRHSEVASNEPTDHQKPQLVDEDVAASETQDSHMKVTPPGESVPKPAPVVVESKNFPQLTQFTEPTTSRIGESDTQQAQNNHNPQQGPDTQDANMKDAPSCEKCGQIFPWNQPHLKWMHKCTVSAQCSESVAKAPTLVAKCKMVPQSGPSTTNRIGESDTQLAATDGDVASCRSGHTFSQKEKHLLVNHKCEPTEVIHTPDLPQRRATYAASNLRRPMSMYVADKPLLVDKDSLESDTQDANMKDAPSCEKCGQIFPWNQPQLKWKHECTRSAESDKSVARPAKPSASNAKSSRPVSIHVAEKQQLFASHTADPVVKKDTTSARNHLQCECGRTFAKGQKGEFMMHKAQCRKEDA